MKITDSKYFNLYYKNIGFEINDLIFNFDFSENIKEFEYLTKASAVYSSNIEGNSIDLNSFMNYKLNKEKFKSGKEIEEIENLITAYKFAQQHKLNENNSLYCHNIASKTLLIKNKRGRYRTGKAGIFGKSGLVYLAIEPEFVEKEMNIFFNDLNTLMNSELSLEQVFYYASLIHLKFVHIHPFRDGNGRIARIIEKWFISKKLGKQFWKLPSEKYYKNNQQRYYENIHLGVNYYELNYDNCLDFLQMLPNCMR